MADENVLLAEVRTEFGKGPSRRARREGKVPAVMYGHGTDPVHFDLPGHEVFLLVKDSANAIVNIKFDGKEQLCLVKAVQVHPVHRNILHVDLLVVRKGEKVEVEIPVIIIGEPVAGTQHQQEEFTLPVRASATAIPETIEVDITGLGEGTVVRVADLKLPAGVESELDADRDIVSVVGLSRGEEAAGDSGEADSAAAAE